MGSATDVASPLPLQLATFMDYVRHFGSLPDDLVSNFILGRHSEPFQSSLCDMQSVGQLYCHVPRFGPVGHH